MMRIGYVGLNRSIGGRANARFRLKSYSEELLIEKVTNWTASKRYLNSM